MKGWVVYLLRCGDGTLYCGTTNDLDRRIADHGRGAGAKYTRGRGPLELVAWAACPDKSSALKAEYAIKRKRTPADKLACLSGLADSPRLSDLPAQPKRAAPEIACPETKEAAEG